MLRSQSSMRFPMYSGTHSTLAFSSSSFGLNSSTAMNQSSAIRKMSGVSHRQQWGIRMRVQPGVDEEPGFAQAAR